MYFQAKWLLRLQNFSPNPIWIAKNRGTEDSTPTGWQKLLHYPFFKYGLIDYRTVLPNEVCIEQDFKKWSNQVYWGNRVLNVLNDKQIPYLMCHSGGKGVHFHIFFKAQGIESITGYKQLRMKLYHYILNWADVPDRLRGPELPFDITSYAFSDTGQGHLIREIGGRKRQRKRVITKIPKDNSIISGDIVYPKKIPIWTVPVDVLRVLELGPSIPLGDCIDCKVTIPSKCIVLSDSDSAVAPLPIQCLVCRKRL